MSTKTPDPLDVMVGAKIRIFRTHRGMSQSDLAGKIGVAFQQVQKYEKGINRVAPAGYRGSLLCWASRSANYSSRPRTICRLRNHLFGCSPNRMQLRVLKALFRERPTPGCGVLSPDWLKVSPTNSCVAGVRPS